METIYIVNLTESAFFRYNKRNESDNGYNKALLELLSTPLYMNKNKQYVKSSHSHWSRADNIIISPKSIPEKFLERYYNELHL